MKKLFLYLAILVIIFFTAFYITRNIYSEKGAIQNSTESDASDSSDITDVSGLQYIRDKLDSTTSTESTDDSKDSLAAEAGILNETSSSDDKYIVGIKNGHVIVYKNDLDNIYEYTGVDADIIKAYNQELYETLTNTINFNTLEELFNFLESIAS